jgi:hypothetical protein
VKDESGTRAVNSVPCACHAPNAEERAERKSSTERGRGRHRALALPDPPPDAVQKSHSAMAARKRRAPFVSDERRRHVVKRAAELDEVARARMLPVVLEEDVAEKPRREHHVEQHEDASGTPVLAAGCEAAGECRKRDEDQRSRDPGCEAVQQRPGEAPGERPAIGGVG